MIRRKQDCCCGCTDTECRCHELEFHVRQNLGRAGIQNNAIIDITNFYPHCCGTMTPCFTWGDPPAWLTAQVPGGSFLRYEIWGDAVLSSEHPTCTDPDPGDLTPPPDKVNCAQTILLGTRDDPEDTNGCCCIPGQDCTHADNAGCIDGAVGIYPPREDWTQNGEAQCCWRWQNFMLIAYSVPVEGPPLELVRCKATAAGTSTGCVVAQETFSGCPTEDLPDVVTVSITDGEEAAEPVDSTLTAGDLAHSCPCKQYGADYACGNGAGTMYLCYQPSVEAWELSLDVGAGGCVTFLVAYKAGKCASPAGTYTVANMDDGCDCWNVDPPIIEVTIPEP